MSYTVPIAMFPNTYYYSMFLTGKDPNVLKMKTENTSHSSEV